jgi:hypothetical protein
MYFEPKNVCSKISYRDKARLNICIAKDLSDSFGGRKADYLKRLNRKLRAQIEVNNTSFTSPIFNTTQPEFYKGRGRFNYTMTASV